MSVTVHNSGQLTANPVSRMFAAPHTTYSMNVGLKVAYLYHDGDILEVRIDRQKIGPLFPKAGNSPGIPFSVGRSPGSRHPLGARPFEREPSPTVRIRAGLSHSSLDRGR